MARIVSEALTSARTYIARGSHVAHRGIEWCAEAAQGVARLPRRLLHR